MLIRHKLLQEGRLQRGNSVGISDGNVAGKLEVSPLVDVICTGYGNMGGSSDGSSDGEVSGNSEGSSLVDTLGS